MYQQWHQAAAEIGHFSGVIQIVPSLSLHQELQRENESDLISEGPASPPSAGAGDLTYHGGPTIGASAKLLNVYLGPQDFDVNDFDAFTKAIVENGYYLSPDGHDASNGKFLGSKSFAWPFGAMTVDDAAIALWVDARVADGTLPAEDGSTMYSLIMPKGSTVTAFGSASCSSFCGYHTMSRSRNYYQVIDDTSCGGCNPGVAHDGRMMVQAHEYAEWRSDPQGNGWFNDSNGQENADECAWNRISWGPAGTAWCVQPFWVNGRNCYTGPYVPPVPTPPPPPPPPKGTSRMIVSKQPVDTLVGQAATWEVSMLNADGSLNAGDSSTIVTYTIASFTNTGSAKAVAGVVSMTGPAFKSVHDSIVFDLHSSPGLPVISTNAIKVSANTPPPPPPPPPPPSKVWVVTTPDGVVHRLTEV